MAAHFRKVPHILERVVDLGLSQRPRGPVGQRLELVELHPGYFADEAGIGDLIPITDESGGDLGVEYVAWKGGSREESGCGSITASRSPAETCTMPSWMKNVRSRTNSVSRANAPRVASSRQRASRSFCFSMTRGGRDSGPAGPGFP